MIVTLLTDYGSDDEFAGVCHGVIRKIHPDVEIVDITHGIPRHDVRRGALVLRNALGYVPSGVHVAIVDPQVGTERRAVVVRCGDGRLLVGPDNGLLSLAWERCQGAAEAWDVSRSPHRLEPVSATFHGRDLFAPVAAALAAGAEPAEAGEPLDTDELARLELPEPGRDGETLVAHVLIVDRFGNATLNLEHEHLAGSGLMLGREVELDVGGVQRRCKLVQAFADVSPGELLVYEDSYRAMAIALNRGDAAAALGLAPDTEVRLTPR
jgi:S-adenosyl-L-methionine hydrolase (adenosine-forming)